MEYSEVLFFRLDFALQFDIQDLRLYEMQTCYGDTVCNRSLSPPYNKHITFLNLSEIIHEGQSCLPTFGHLFMLLPRVTEPKLVVISLVALK